MKTFLFVLEWILKEKYPNVKFGFYLSTWSKNVHMGLDCNLLCLPEHVDIISDIENIWQKRKGIKFSFATPMLI